MYLPNDYSGLTTDSIDVFHVWDHHRQLYRATYISELFQLGCVLVVVERMGEESTKLFQEKIMYPVFAFILKSWMVRY